MATYETTFWFQRGDSQLGTFLEAVSKLGLSPISEHGKDIITYKVTFARLSVYTFMRQQYKDNIFNMEKKEGVE